MLWFAHRYVSKKYAGKTKGEPIQLIGRKGLGQKAQLVLVDVHGARYLLGVTEGGVNLIDKLAHSGAMKTHPVTGADQASAVEPIPFESILDDAHASSLEQPGAEEERPAFLSGKTWKDAARTTFGRDRA